MLVEASQTRVSRRSLTLDREEDDAESNTATSVHDDFAEDEMALRDAEDEMTLRDAEDVQRNNDESDVMEAIATQTQTVPQTQRDMNDDVGDDNEDEDGDELREVSHVPPPVFRPLAFNLEGNLEASVKRRLRKNHEIVLEEQPKWALLAKVLKEIEDTIARVTESHAGEFCLLARLKRDLALTA
jgi:DNA excision repair protein ERCC-4